MNNTIFSLAEVNFELMDLQVFLQEQYPSFCIEGLSMSALSDGSFVLTIFSENEIPQNLAQSVLQTIASFTPPEAEAEPAVFTAEELTNIVSEMYLKLAKKNIVDMNSINGIKLSTKLVQENTI